MADPLEAIKDPVRNLRPYSLAPEYAAVKINQNESPWDVHRSVKEEATRRMTGRAWSRYPDFVAAALHERLAGFCGWKAEGILTGNGSNELIQALLMVTVGAGERVLISEPTFALYRQITTVLGGEIVSTCLTRDFRYDIESLRSAVRAARPAVTIICSPNNPTGSLIEARDLIILLEATRGLVAVDEAYFEFAESSVASLLNDYPNLIIFRTFSKAMAMAALRIGYLLAAPEVAREVSKAVLPYNLNLFSQTAAEVALEMYEAKIRPLVRIAGAERDRLHIELKRIPGLAPLYSRANFMVVRSSIEPRRVCRELLKRDILVRDVSSQPMLEDYFRTSVGTHHENDLLIRALREIFEAGPEN
jgi:histidinol-phosphate aminotransferase